MQLRLLKSTGYKNENISVQKKTCFYNVSIDSLLLIEHTVTAILYWKMAVIGVLFI